MSGISAEAKSGLLGGLSPAFASAHTGYPGVTGSNECSGGSYARKAVTFSAPSGSVRALAAPVTFDINSQTVRWIGFWNAANVFLFSAPNGGATPKNFMSLPGRTIYSAAHGYTDGRKIVFYNGTPPGGLTEGVIYFVRDVTDDTFSVASTLGGAAIDLTLAPSFGCVVCAITEDVHTVPGTQVLSSASIVIPD